MFSKRTLPVLLLFLALGLVYATQSLGWGGKPETKYDKILHNVGELIAGIHFSPKNVDDEFSKTLFKKFLTDKFVDEGKNVLLQSDVQSLKVFETKLDDEINGGSVEFVPAVSNIVKKRLPEVQALVKDILSKPFDFTKEETYVMDPDKLDFPKNESERKEQWRKRLKYLALSRYSDLLDNRESNKSTAGFKIKTNAELEKESRDKVQQIMDRSFERLIIKVSEEDRFNDYINLLTETMDPHSSFFPPVDKRYFDEQMSGRFFGIGASLKEEDGNIKIGTLLAGSPAWKSGQVQVGDVVLKVGQGADEPVELVGFETQDAVKIIRGKKGTEVRLTLKKADGSVKVVVLIRDEIIQDEVFAKSAVINSGSGKLGYIYLSEFYADFDNPKGARCSEDVKKEIIKLKEQGVEGIVMDLRNNGGGSLYDVVQMVGLFIESGPIVQVKDRDGKPQVYYDYDKSALYDGPLAVMVNEFSASASEIFAAAIQDYNRGIIIGSSSTYGKGTVQRNIGLDRILGKLEPNSDLGTIKLTLQKFYRINGGSTQLKGVLSDITLPDIYEYSKLREKDNLDALPFDMIQKADYRPWKYGLSVNEIKTTSLNRIQSGNAFNVIRKNATWIAEQNEKPVPLSLKKYQEEQKKIKDAFKEIDSNSKVKSEVEVSAIAQDLKKFEYDAGKLERFKSWIKALRKDIYLEESVNILSDMVQKKNVVYNK